MSNKQTDQQDHLDEPEKLLSRLLVEAKRVEATSPKVNTNKPADYFDIELFKKAQATCQKYYTNLSLASSTGLMLLLQNECILTPLLTTGKSRTVANLHNRYLDTAIYVRKLYETDFFDKSSEGWKYISLVRGMHQRIHKVMNEDVDGKTAETSDADDDNKCLLVNQYDMALTQFAFVGLFLLKPKKCGAYQVTREELEHVVYYWRLISYYFGIEDKFNIFSFHHNLEKQLSLMNLILEHQNKKLTLNRQPVGCRMAKGFTLAFEDFTTETSFNILDHWWSPDISLSGLTTPKPYTWSDRRKLFFFNLYFVVLFRSEFMLRIMNNHYKKKFDKFSENRTKINGKLDKKYKDITYE